MKQCEIEFLIEDLEKGKGFYRTGIKRVCWIDKVEKNMTGVIIELKKVQGFWVINEIYEGDREIYEINRGWHVGGL